MSSTEGSMVGARDGDGSGGAAPRAAGYLAVDVENNLRRSAETLAAQDEIALLEARLAKLREENEDRATTASLRFQGNAADWEALSHEKKWKKENVLAILSCKENGGALPKLLKESNREWFYCDAYESYSEKMPFLIKSDDDIFQARVCRQDFQMHHIALGGQRSPLVHLQYYMYSEKAMDVLVANLPDFFYWVRDMKRHAHWTHGCAPRLKLFLMHAKDPVKICPLLERSKVEFDSELMLLAAKKCAKALMYLPEKLRNDESFALQVLATLSAPRNKGEIREDNCLAYFSESVRKSKKVAYAFVRYHGRSYEHVHYSIRKEDPALARIACRTYPQVLWKSVPGPVERSLTSDKSFMLDLFQRCRGEGHPMFWRLLSPKLKHDRDLAIEALASECVELDDLTNTWKTDRAFWLQALGENCFLWYDTLPAHFREDQKFAIELSDFALIFGDLMESFPSLSFEPDMWEKFLKSDLSFLNDDLYFFLKKWASSWIFGNKKLMLLAIPQGFHIYGAVKEPLDVDREILQAAVSKEGVHAICSMSWDVIRLYPDLCADALRNSSPVDADFLEDLIDEGELGPAGSDIWENRNILSAWFEAGGFWHDDIPESCKKDKEMMLIAAKHEHSTKAFSKYASAELRRDKEYMLRALEASNGRLYSNLSQAQKTDYDFLLTVFALHDQVGKEFRSTNRDIIKFAARVRSRLKLYSIFQKLILCAMSVSTSGSNLRLLDRGEETLTAFKKNLAGFLDVPDGNDLQLLRQASENLARWGF